MMEDAVYYGEDCLGRPGRPRYYTNDDDDDDGNCCTRGCKKCCKCVQSVLLTFLIFLATGAGIGVGVALKLFVPLFAEPETIPRIMMYIFYVAELMVRFMTFLVVPLVISSLISGVGALQSSSSGKIGLRTLLYYVSTTVIAVGEGLGFVYPVRPGSRATTYHLQQDGQSQMPLKDVNKIDALLDMFRNVIPDNFVKAGLELVHTEVSYKNVETSNGTLSVESFSLGSSSNVNILGLTFFSILFGVAVSKLGNKGRVVYLFFDGIFEACLVVMRGAFWLYPISMFFIMMHTVISLKNPLEQLKSVFMFVLTVVLGLFCHACLVLPILFVAFTRRNPFKHLYGCFRAIVTAFASNNSAVTLPVTMDCLIKTGIHPRIIRFVCPIGATINMDGLAVYEAMACIFIATLRGIVLGPVQIVAMAFTAVAVSIGAPTTGGGLTLYIILFTTIGLPIQDIFLLLPFDWMLARFRTVVNVWSDCIGSAIVEKCSRTDLRKLPEEDGTNDGHSMDLGHPDGAVLTGYHRKPRDWTVRLVNERGDKMVVSKV